MRLFKRLRRKLDYLTEDQIELVHQAFLLAYDAHRGQTRRTGEAYITHPVAVACILAEMKLDHQSIMAALMHDVIEDTEVDKETLAAQFGDTVADLVDGVSKLTQIEFVSRAEAQAENFRKMVLAMARDIRVILVKLSDRLHNMRTLGSLHLTKRRRIARETLDIFAPIAKRLGMREFSVELEELSFQALHPMRYAVLKNAVHKARGNRNKILSGIKKELDEGVKIAVLPQCEIAGREKHLYSIYRKMRAKKLTFSEIMDVYAYRLIVDKVDTCYRALGVVHGLYKPVPERFKDYIAIPKSNGYQSLHTTLFGPFGLPIEVQIRTTKMDHMATSGIAAHWLYKTGSQVIDQSQVRAQKWVKNLLELQQSSGNSLEFIESVKVDLFPDEVYVFTPRGNIMSLPAGATPIDFAYAVHTDIGNACVAVKVDRQLASLSAPLVSGQSVEIVTAKHAQPNPAWMDFVVTSKARSGIRHYLKNQRRVESVALGKQLLQQALQARMCSLKKISDSAMAFVLKDIQLESTEDLFCEIGLGNRIATLVAQRLTDVAVRDGDLTALESLSDVQGPLVIKGTEGMALSFAKCCEPLPGDPIVGIMNVGSGIMVHVEHCQKISKLRHQVERCVSLRWAEDASGDFAVTIELEVINQRGVLAVVALGVSDAGGNIEDINVLNRGGQHYIVTLKLIVQSRSHLAKVVRTLRRLSQVLKIARHKN